jgi:FkbM family methyltransferase
MVFEKENGLPYPQPWEWVVDNIEFTDDKCFYVDIGAYDGLSSSNSAHFDINLGWDGICIEPHPFAFSELEKNRKRSINMNMCVSSIDGEVDFLSIDRPEKCAEGWKPEMLSGIYDQYSDHGKNRISNDLSINGGSTKLIKIKSKPLNDILKEKSIIKVDYLSIDTEGSEYDILSSVDFDYFDIRVITAENNSGSDDVKRLLEKNGYVFLTKCCSDEIYAKR